MMLTVFDFEVTDAERNYLRINFHTKEEYLNKVNEYSRLSDLFILFKLRGDEEKANYFLELLKNQEKK